MKIFIFYLDTLPRNPIKEEITQFHMDIAASIQKVTEDIMIKLAKSLRNEYKIKKFMSSWRSSFKLCGQWKNS